MVDPRGSTSRSEATTEMRQAAGPPDRVVVKGCPEVDQHDTGVAVDDVLRGSPGPQLIHNLVL